MKEAMENELGFWIIDEKYQKEIFLCHQVSGPIFIQKMQWTNGKSQGNCMKKGTTSKITCSPKG